MALRLLDWTSENAMPQRPDSLHLPPCVTNRTARNHCASRARRASAVHGSLGREMASATSTSTASRPALPTRQVLAVFSGLILPMLFAALDSTIGATALRP